MARCNSGCGRSFRTMEDEEPDNCPYCGHDGFAHHCATCGEGKRARDMAAEDECEDCMEQRNEPEDTCAQCGEPLTNYGIGRYCKDCWPRDEDYGDDE